MSPATRIRLVLALAGLVAASVTTLGGATSATSVEAAAPQVKILYPYRAELQASYSVSFQAAAASGRSVVSFRAVQPMHVEILGTVIRGRPAPFQKSPARASVSISTTGATADGCAYSFDRKLQAPVIFELNAVAPISRSMRLLSKQVPSAYWLEILAYPAGPLPRFVTSCPIDVPVAPALGARDILQNAIQFNAAETMVCGAWQRAFGPVGWPFVPYSYRQAWPRPPATSGGKTKFMAPLDKLSNGKLVRLVCDVTRTDTGSGIQIVRKGKITFTFRPT